jgi:pimeloyl-ACP methyl ester carboxylesterase
VALLTAIRRPDLVTAVAVFESPMHWLPWWPAGSAGAAIAERTSDPGAAAEAFVRRVAGDRAWDDLPQRTQDDRRAEGPAMLADIASIQSSASPFDPADNAVPLLIGAGTESRDHQRDGARCLAEHTGADLVEIEGGAHTSHMTHPEEFAAFVRRAVALGLGR